jgi:hypothetical protein
MNKRDKANLLKTQISSELNRIKKLDSKGLTYPRLRDDFLVLKKTINKLEKFVDKLKEHKEVSITKQAVKDKLKQAKQETRELFNSVEDLIVPITKKSSEVRTIERKTKYDQIKQSEIIKNRTKNDRLALGGSFKQSFITDGLNEPLPHLKNMIKVKLENEFLNSDRKFNIVVFIVVFYNVIKSDGSKEIRHFNSNTMYITSFKVIGEFVDELFEMFLNNLEACQNNSDVVFDKFIEFQISTSKSKSIAGKSYIELPTWIKNKQVCVNIKNNDIKCFKWALLSAKYYDKINSKSKNEVRHYKKYYDDIIEPVGCEFPVKINDIELWEVANDMKINVLEIMPNKNNFQTIYTSNHYKENVVNLLLIENGSNSHYVWIKNVNGLFANNDVTKCNRKTKFICPQCLCPSFSSQDKLDRHLKLKLCQAFNVEQQHCELELPQPGENKMKFQNVNNEFKHPYHVFADFESTLEPVEEVNGSTVKYQKHTPNSFGLKYNCIHDEYSEPLSIYNDWYADNVSKTFVLELERLAKKSYDLIQQNKYNIVMTDEDIVRHQNSNKCERCLNEFTNDNLTKKVKHHDHITGQFIGSYCNSCNLKYRYKLFLPVYIHNLKGYDSHLFVKALCKYGSFTSTGDNVGCIPNNEERYISISKNIKVDEYEDYDEEKGKNVMKPVMMEIRFLDTFAFMATSIDKLSENLVKDCKSVEDKRKIFKNVSEYFKDDNEFDMMTRKGVYPYDYITDYDKFKVKKFPHIDAFNSELNNSKCSMKDYDYAKKVWSVFNCKTFLDYHNLYLTVDVLILADIWENFREVCFNVYKLDCEYYYTAPGLSFDAMLKHTKVELELFTELEMFIFVENGIRGGISQISKRHAEANNKYMSNYDTNKEDSYIVYLDANNLYGYAMCEYLPVKDFKWNTDEWTKDDIFKLDDKGERGYLFEVDLHIPEELHDYFNNYVPCPENVTIKKDWVSDWMKPDYKQTKITKLCSTFIDKKDYVVNYRYLKLVLSLGVKLKKVKRVLEYEQSNFMASYIMKNTLMRQQAKNDFEKDFYKLMNNSVFGKTMENVRNRINFRLISTEDQALRVKNMKRFTIFDDDLVGVHIHKKKVKLNKPIYLGQNILDDSKHLMYNFHYNFMLKKVDRENIDLLFTDTDSLCYHIKKQDIFQIMNENKDYFDLSDYPKDHPLYDDKNKKVMGKFKNESVGEDKQLKINVVRYINEFIGLRAKLYTFTHDGEIKSHNKCKGVKSCVVKKEITIDDYRNTLYNRENKIIQQNGIRSYEHQLYTERVSKIALSCRDDKVYICDDNVHTYNHGHYKTKII